MARPKKDNVEEEVKEKKEGKDFDLEALRKELKKELINLDQAFHFFLTGHPLFDAYVGSGGLPKYQMIYIWGTNSIGKSTFAQQILASYQKQFTKNSIQVYFDREESLTKLRLRSLGVKDDIVFILCPENIEAITDYITGWAAKYQGKKIDIFAIWDTIAMTPAKEETEGYDKLATQARALAGMFKKIKFFDFNLTMFVLNQHREKIGERFPTKEPTGGNAVKHKSFLSLCGHSKKSEIWPDTANVGSTTVMDSVKSKIVSPHRKMAFEYTYVHGYDSILTMIHYMWKDMKVLTKASGRWKFAGEEETYSLKQLYKYFMSDESVDRWKMVIEEIYNNLYPDDDETFISQAKKRIFDYYFEGNKINLDRFTSINVKVVDKEKLELPAVSEVDDAIDNMLSSEEE